MKKKNPTLPRLLLAALISIVFLQKNVAQNETYLQRIAFADSLVRSGENRQAAEAYSFAFEAFGGRGYAEDRFKAARAWALAGVADSTFFHLNRLAEKTDFLMDKPDWEDQADFEFLKKDLRWMRLKVQVASKKDRRAAAKQNPLSLELEQIYTLDQWYRVRWDSVISLHGRNSPEFKDFLRRNQEQDSLNELRVTQMLDEKGWLGKDDVTERAGKALYLVIQHADLAIQEKYLPMMRQAAASGKAASADLAYLEDRVLMRQGRPQRYGSQIVPDKQTGEWMLYEVEDPENIDKRRASVGLGPIQDYLNSMGARMRQ